MELANDNLSSEIVRLYEEIKFLRKQNEALLNKLVGRIERPKIDTAGMEPIGGFVPFRHRVAELERKSREEAARIAEEEEKFRLESNANKA